MTARYVSLHFLLLLFLAAPLAFGVPPQPQSPLVAPPMPSSLKPGQKAPQVTDIWVVFKTHCDLGYTKSAEAVNTDYRVPMMDNAIRLYEADREKPADQRFKWTIAGWPMQANILGPLQDPARKEKIEQGLRDGAFAVHALPATIHPESMDLEDLVRGFSYSSRVARTYGLPLSISGKMTDVPGHAWIMPSLLHHAGVEFLQLGCNYACNSMRLPGLFWWEGPDGSRVFCHYSAKYGSDITPPKDWPAKNYLAVIMTHDNVGPPSAAQVKAVRDAVARMPGVTLHMATMDDFAKAVLAEKPDLQVVRGDMVDSWIHGLSSMPNAARMARATRPLLSALAILDTELKTWNIPTADVAPTLGAAYEKSLLYGEHTYGPLSPGRGFWITDYKLPSRYHYGDAFRDARKKGFYTSFEASFNDKRQFAIDLKNITETNLQARLSSLAKSVNTEGKRIVVFNALPWKRSGIVELDGKRYFANDVPAGGYITIKNPTDPTDLTDLKNNTLETVHFKATFDLSRGGITSLIEKSTGRELVDTSSPYALGQFLHEQFSYEQTLHYYNCYNTMNNSFYASVKPDMPRDVPYAAISPSAWKAKVHRSTLGDRVILSAGDTKGLAETITLSFTFPKHEATMQTAWKMTDKHADTLPEGGWLCYPLAVKDPRFLLGRIGGVMDLAKDQLPGGNRYLYGIESGVNLLAPDGKGMGVCAMDAPTMSFGEPGLWKYDFTYLPTKPAVFVHLYNNMWNTNFPYWIEGDLSSEVKIWPVANSKTDAICTPSWEARLPLLAAAADGSAGPLPTSQNGISVSRAGVLVTTFGPNPDGEGTVLRLWEQAGLSGPMTITLPPNAPWTHAQPVNLRGEVQGPAIPINTGTFTIDLPHHAPASFVLQ
ncbi:MAG: hypothetical protein H7A51_15005 [Akkermansiaceae bacterium]|nr:hypothetical protein [Akkermansiaceae bacterium]